ncbi:MAG: LysM peptidoglycan-binding domain-containing protein [Saprospiraceae bacterium]|nr:LysM peptidoglycan-binding domain-containing protein [Saprospiraceae bacterium]
MRKVRNPVMAFAVWVALQMFCYPATARAADSLRYLSHKDTVLISIGPNDEKMVEHYIQAKQTLYSLARFYGISVEELYLYNPGLKEKVVAVGQLVKVPVPNAAIKRYKEKGFSEKDHAPVYYVVRKGDTMFRISKIYFRMPTDTVQKRNGLSSDVIKEGQLLLVGWMSVKGIPEELRQYIGSELERGSAALGKLYRLEAAAKKEVNEQGKAFWQKNSREDSNLYALHRSADLSSIIKVTNPMNNAVVYVKVIGRIPDTVYEKEVVIVLSPLAAKHLGAQDTRFFARVKYFK